MVIYARVDNSFILHLVIGVWPCFATVFFAVKSCATLPSVGEDNVFMEYRMHHFPGARAGERRYIQGAVMTRRCLRGASAPRDLPSSSCGANGTWSTVDPAQASCSKSHARRIYTSLRLTIVSAKLQEKLSITLGFAQHLLTGFQARKHRLLTGGERLHCLLLDNFFCRGAHSAKSSEQTLPVCLPSAGNQEVHASKGHTWSCEQNSH